MAQVLLLLLCALCVWVLVRPAPWQQTSWGVVCMHLMRTVLCGFLAAPVAVSFLVMYRLPFLVLPSAALAGLAMGWWPASRAALPVKTWQRYGLPALGLWVLIVGFFPAIFLRAFGEGSFATGFVPHLYITGYIAGFSLRERRRPDRVPLAPLDVGGAVLRPRAAGQPHCFRNPQGKCLPCQARAWL